MKHIFIMRESNDLDLINDIVSLMKNNRYEIRYTKSLQDATTIASQYSNSEEVCRLYAIGGDGMAHFVINGMVHSNNELVVVPRGTGNDFARSIYDDIKSKDIIKNSLDKESKYINLIKINDIYCDNVICCGFDAEIGNTVHDLNDNRLIPRNFQYSYNVLKKLKHIKFFPTKIEVDGKVIFKDKTAVCAFCNGQYFGGGFKVGKNASFFDDNIDVNIIGDISKKQLFKYVKALFRQTLDKQDEYYHYSYPEMVITTTQRLNVDGEEFEPGVYTLKKEKNVIKIVI